MQYFFSDKTDLRFAIIDINSDSYVISWYSQFTSQREVHINILKDSVMRKNFVVFYYEIEINSPLLK